MQAGHHELPQQQHMEQLEVQGAVRNRFRKSQSRGPLEPVCEADDTFLKAIAFELPHQGPQPELDSEQMWLTNRNNV